MPYLPGLDRPAAEGMDLNRSVETAVAAIRARAPRGPIRLMGYSNGGYVAFHVARRLASLARPVDTLALLDSSAYYPPRRVPPPAQRLAEALRTGLARGLHREVLLALLRLRRLEAARRFVRASQKLAGGRPADALQLEVLIELWQEGVRRYPPLPYAGPVTLFKAEKGRPRITDPWLGWAPFAPQIERFTLAGSHWTMMLPPLARENATTVVRTLGLEDGVPSLPHPSVCSQAPIRSSWV